ncbi:Mce family protein [Gordonia hirsuta DSM 44140 = NBRC 16056]|uniref:Mce family protein n=1 Tax=Gordonia hirsuta DSM 44140 = NBRC 16056 TaxID=1121927 RepID=L7LDJ2_9ACTN|nr:MlaD family protein [Gordonia hirsuta]GAC58132.1 Mce family protein [Gordonia hirsuta DSM 44140 = NBRC 16056]
MKPWRTALTLVVAFVVLVGSASLVVARIMMAPVPGDKVVYTALFTDVSGLYAGDSVRVAGVAVGKIESVELDGGTAQVRFSAQADRPLDATTRIAVRYQNLVGQRYLEVIRTPDATARQDPSEPIPTTRTVPSFDVTELFNGIAPLIGEIDPAILNKFAGNVGLLLQGDGRGLGPAADAVDEIVSLVKRRDVVLLGLVDNISTLAEQIEGRSGRVAELVTQLNSSIMQFTTRIATVIESLDYGDRVLVPLVDLVETLQGSYDSNYGPLDAFFHRVVPFSPQLLQGLEAIPGLLSGMNDGMTRNAAATYHCAGGRLDLPVITNLLIGGREVVVCR